MEITIDDKFKDFHDAIEKAIKDHDKLDLHCSVWELRDLPPISDVSAFILKSAYGGVRPYHNRNAEEKREILVKHGAKRCLHMYRKNVLDTYRNIYDVLLETGKVFKVCKNFSYERYNETEAKKTKRPSDNFLSDNSMSFAWVSK